MNDTPKSSSGLFYCFLGHNFSSYLSSKTLVQACANFNDKLCFGNHCRNVHRASWGSSFILRFSSFFHSVNPLYYSLLPSLRTYGPLSTTMIILFLKKCNPNLLDSSSLRRTSMGGLFYPSPFFYWKQTPRYMFSFWFFNGLMDFSVSADITYRMGLDSTIAKKCSLSRKRGH